MFEAGERVRLKLPCALKGVHEAEATILPPPTSTTRLRLYSVLVQHHGGLCDNCAGSDYAPGKLLVRADWVHPLDAVTLLGRLS